jgi:serine/threonine-protein kinase
MLPRAKAAAARALELDPGLAEAHATLGLVSQNLDWQWNEVEAHYRQAIALEPNYATAHHWYAEFLSILGRFEESRREFARAREIDPISTIIRVDEAQLNFFERNFGAASARLEDARQTDPSFEMVHERLALIHMIEGREQKAWEEVRRVRTCREPSSDCFVTWTAWLPQRDLAAAKKALLELEAATKRRHIAPMTLLVAHMRQGEIERALDWLERMADRHEVWLITIKVNPVFDPLRSNPRFQAVLRRLGLA